MAVVTGASPNDRALETLVRDELTRHVGALTFTYISGLSVEETVQRVSHLPARTALLFVSFAQDSQGRSLLPNDAVRLIARAASVPTYVNSEDVVEAGLVGGSLMSFTAVGEGAAVAALRILDGREATAMPFTEASARTITIDALELKRWSIPITRVPAGSAVLNQVPTAWETYRWRIVSVILLVEQSVLIATLLVQRRRWRLAEAGLRSSEERRHTAVLDERNRMARDMHDTLAQGFTGIIVQLQAAEQARAHSATTDMGSHLARRASSPVRASVTRGGPSARSDRRHWKQAASAQHSRGCSKRSPPTRVFAPPLPHAVHREPRLALTEENLVRIQQEMLTNIFETDWASTEVGATLCFDAEGLRSGRAR